MIATLIRRWYKSSPRSRKPARYSGLDVQIGDAPLPRPRSVSIDTLESGLKVITVEFAVTEIVEFQTTTVGEPKRRKVKP